MKNTLKFGALAVVFAATGAHAVDAFDPSSNLLTLDSVTVSGTSYRNVAVKVNSYSLVGIAGGSPAADTFDSASNTLVLGAVALQGTTYNNATVKINSYTLLSVGGTPTPGTLAAPNYTGEMAGYLTKLNTYRTQCGIPALSQNTLLDSALATSMAYANANPFKELPTMRTYSASAGYSIPTTVGNVSASISSQSTNSNAIGETELQTALTDAGAMLNLMRPFTDIGIVSSRGVKFNTTVALGNPVQRNIGLVTFPCGNTTDIAPYAIGGGGASSSTPPGAQWQYYIYDNLPIQHGTPIAVFANIGDSLVLTSSTVTLRGGVNIPLALIGTTVPLVVKSSNTDLYPNEAYVWPKQWLQQNATYEVVLNGTVNGTEFSKTFTFSTGTQVPLILQ